MARAKKSICFDLHIARRKDGIIHLYAKRGSKNLFVSTVDPRPASRRHHAKLYEHLDRLLRAELG